MTRRAAALIAALLAVPSCGHEVAPAGGYADPASLPVPDELRVEQQRDGSLFLEWEEEDEVFAVIDGWYVYRGEVTGEIDAATLARITPEVHTFRNYIDTRVEIGRTYAYQVRAVSPAGVVGRPSPTVALTVDLEPPGTPAGLVASARVLGPGEGCPAGFFCAVVTVAWERPPDADLAAFRLYRLPPFPGGDFVETPFVQFEDAAVAPQMRYRYRVAALDFTGNESPPTPEVDVLVPAGSSARR